MRHLRRSVCLCALLPALLASPAVDAQSPDAEAATALLIIDIQDFYYPGGTLPLSAPEPAGANAARLLAAARAGARPVVHVGHNAKAGRGFRPEVAPRADETVLMKDEINAFVGTDLQAVLQRHGVTRLVLCGMQTHMCVEAATRAAHDLGYEVLVVGDACATRDLTHGGTTVPAAQVHAATLATLDRAYAKIVTMDEALAALAPPAPRTTFTAVTLNIWHDQHDWPARRAVIVDTLRALAPDVVLLQEVLEKEGLPNQARQLADSLGYAYVFASVDPQGGPKRYGNAILTRLPIVATHEVKLPPLDDWRVAAHAHLALPAGGQQRHLDVYVTHLHHTDEGGAIRAEQVAGLLAFVDATRAPADQGAALLIGGDFNAQPDRPELAPLFVRTTDALAAVHPGLTLPGAATFGPATGTPPLRIDYLFCEAAGLTPLGARIVLGAPDRHGTWGSDHCGVWACFEARP